MEKREITPEEVKGYVMEIPINVAANTRKLAEYAKGLTDNGELSTAVAISAAKAFVTVVDYGCPADSTLTFQELEEWSEKCRVNNGILHRVNHLMYEYVIELLDIVEDRKLRGGNSQKYVKPMQKVFNGYVNAIRRNSEKTAYYIWSDHIRLCNDVVGGQLTQMYEAVRDRMIALGERFRSLHRMQDIEILAKVEVILLLMRMAKYTRRDYFSQYKEACGVDFSRHYKYMDLQDMVKMFCLFVECLGVRLSGNEHGDVELAGFRYEKSFRCGSAWNRFLDVMRDDGAVEEAAEKALKENPDAYEQYRHVFEEEERRTMA